MKFAPASLLIAMVVTASFSGHEAWAQTETRTATVYRCGKDGRDLRDFPCPEASRASQVQFDQPSSADAQATRARSAADAKLAAQMEQDRLKKEAEARRQSATALRIGPPPPADAASAPLHHLAAKRPKPFRIRVPRAASAAG